jgi:hypothetical protein
VNRNAFHKVKPAFVVDPNYIARNSGRQIDWDNVPDSYRPGGGTGAKLIPAGQAVCELTGGKIIPRVNRPGSEACAGFLETTAIENEPGHSKSGYSVIVGGVLYEPLLPDATAGKIPAAYKTELAAATHGNAVGFAFTNF